MVTRRRELRIDSRSAVDAVELHALTLEASLDLPGGVLAHRLVSVQCRRDAGRDDLKVDLVPNFVFISEAGVGRADVRVIFAGVVLGHVGEPEVSFRVECHTRVVDRLQLTLVPLQHPVDLGLRMTVRGLARQLIRFTFFSSHNLLTIGFLEGIELGSPYKDRVGCSGSPLVVGEALVLSQIFLLGLADDESASTGLLRDTVVVARVFE